MPVALGTLCLITRGYFYPLLFSFSYQIESKLTFLIYPDVQRQNHPDKQTNTKNAGHVHRDDDFVQGFAALCLYTGTYFSKLPCIS